MGSLITRKHVRVSDAIVTGSGTRDMPISDFQKFCILDELCLSIVLQVVLLLPTRCWCKMSSFFCRSSSISFFSSVQFLKFSSIQFFVVPVQFLISVQFRPPGVAHEHGQIMNSGGTPPKVLVWMNSRKFWVVLLEDVQLLMVKVGSVISIVNLRLKIWSKFFVDDGWGSYSK